MSSDEPEIIDAEIVEGHNLPAVEEQQASNSEPIELPNRQDTLLADNPDRRCVATNSRGERCRKFAIYGSTVCRTHGGATKHVKMKARIRVENAQNKLMGKLIDFAFDDTKPPDVQLRAIRDALDRGGLKPPAEVVLSQGEAKPYEELFDGLSTMSRAESRRARGVPDTEDNFAGVESAHSQVSSQEGLEDESSRPPTQSDSPNQGDNRESCARRKFRDPTTDARDVDYQGASVSGQQEARSGSSGAVAPPTPHRIDRDTHPQPPIRHITGEAAMRLANEANRAIGALPEPLALPSPHKRYRRP